MSVQGTFGGPAMIPILQVRDNAAIVYYEPCFSKVNNLKKRANMRFQQKHSYSGKVTDGARKRMVKAITLLSQITKPRWIHNPVTDRLQLHRFSFITLTVASDKMLTAKQAHRLLLSHFLDWLRRTKKIKLYIWKAELQRRGQIHYHLTIPDFIHYQEIRDTWNRIQREAGLLDDFAKKWGHYDPNSTDIHEVTKVKNMSSYLVKELTKSINAKRLQMKKIVESLVKAGEITAEQMEAKIDEFTGEEMKTEGKIWGCSEALSEAKYFALEMTSFHEENLNRIEGLKGTRKVVGDWWSVIYFTDAGPPDILDADELGRLKTHLRKITDIDTCPN